MTIINNIIYIFMYLNCYLYILLSVFIINNIIIIYIRFILIDIKNINMKLIIIK